MRATVFSATSPLADDVGLGVAGTLERVFDEAGDVLLVFDNQNPVLGHDAVTQ